MVVWMCVFDLCIHSISEQSCGLKSLNQISLTGLGLGNQAKYSTIVAPKIYISSVVHDVRRRKFAKATQSLAVPATTPRAPNLSHTNGKSTRPACPHVAILGGRR
jgi:hypothetical protein